MNKFGLTLSLTILFVFNFTNGYAVQDSLFLYTRTGCPDCHSVKQILNESGISYIERTLDNDKFGPQMLQKLSLAGFHKRIHLPVIFLNNQLLHPAYKTSKGLIDIPIIQVEDSLKNKFQKGELNLALDKQPATISGTDSSQVSSDCVVKVPVIYLICDSYKTETEANTAKNKLISDGYNFAGILFYQNRYRVFTQFYSDHTLAGSGLNGIKKDFPTAYLFEMPGE